MSDIPRYDPAPIGMLRRVGGEELASKMVEMFCENAPQKIAAANSALDKLDSAGLALAAHSLKSSAGQLGASRLQQMCADIESEVPTETTRPKIVHMLELVEAEMKEAAEWLNEELGRRPTQAMARIAVVEDNPDNMLLVRLLLEDQYELDEYSDGKSALNGMSQQVPSVALLDISLPGMDGMEVLSHMKESAQLRAVPVIALTAHAGQTDRERFISAGFDDYVTKPIVDEKQLLSAVSRLVAKLPAR